MTDHVINPTVGIFQGDVYASVAFSLYNDDIIGNRVWLFIQAFIDDIAIQTKDIALLDWAYNEFSDKMKEKELSLNVSKCVLILNDENDAVTDKATSEVKRDLFLLFNLRLSALALLKFIGLLGRKTKFIKYNISFKFETPYSSGTCN